jgi:hypothetical protein
VIGTCGGVSRRTALGSSAQGPADAADVGASVNLAHGAFEDAGGEFGAADAGQRLADGGVQAGEDVRAGRVEGGVGGGEPGGDAGGELVLVLQG